MMSPTSQAQAIEAQLAFQRAGGLATDPTGPFYVWLARLELQCFEERFRHGDDSALMESVACCARSGLPLPRWLAAEVVERQARVKYLHVSSWDEVFGKPFPKGKTRESAKRLRYEQARVFLLAQRLRDERGMKLDAELFETIGRLTKIRDPKKRYYDAANSAKLFRRAMTGERSRKAAAISGKSEKNPPIK